MRRSTRFERTEDPLVELVRMRLLGFVDAMVAHAMRWFRLIDAMGSSRRSRRVQLSSHLGRIFD